MVQLRAEVRDYVDIDALLTSGKVDLPTALAAAQRLYGPAFNPEVTLKALAYFDDEDLQTIPDEDMRRIRRYVTDDDFREALDQAPQALSTPAPGHTGI